MDTRIGLRTRLEHAVDKHSVGIGAWLLRRTEGRIVRLWRRRALVLTVPGRRSRQPRTAGVAAQAEMGSPYQLRTVEESSDWFAGLELVPPGVVPVTRWRPDPVEVGWIHPVDGYGGVARSPDHRRSMTNAARGSRRYSRRPRACAITTPRPGW